MVLSKLYDKQYDFNFDLLIEMFLTPLPMVYTSRSLLVLQAYVLTLVSSTTETDLCFDCYKLLKQGYRYNTICKAFSKFYHRY